MTFRSEFIFQMSHYWLPSSVSKCIGICSCKIELAKKRGMLKYASGIGHPYKESEYHVYWTDTEDIEW